MNTVLFLIITILLVLLLLLGLAWSNAQQRIRKLEKDTKDKDEVLSLIGHNLRGSLFATEGLGEIVTEYIEEGELEEVQETFNELDTNLQSSRELTEKLISYTMSQSPKAGLSIESLDINKVLEDVFLRFSRMINKKSITLHRDFAQGEVLADKFALDAVLGVIFENALRFSPQNSAISITGDFESNNRYKIAISDSGPGFESIDNEFSFNRKGIQEDAEGMKSVGLGLITAKSWLQEIGGTIFVSTNKTDGAGVTIVIPAFSNNSTI